jgi:hypothetical protein
MIIEVYKFLSEEDAQSAIQNINNHFGIPVSEDSVTQTYCGFEAHPDGFLFIRYMPELFEILGSPVNVNIDVNPF